MAGFLILGYLDLLAMLFSGALLYEREWREKIKGRSDGEKFQLILHKCGLLSLHAMLQIGVWTAIIFLQIRSVEIEQVIAAATGIELLGSLATVAIYSALIEVMPFLVPYLARWSKWDNPKYRRMHKTAGFYAAYAIGLLVLGLSEVCS